MMHITIRILEGLERGRVFAHLPTPVTIGREDENNIQLNDDRVSRFHAKLQEDDGKVILTDLDSTNGTRVNGHPIQMRVIQTGDVLAIGRCLLAIGEIRESVNPNSESSRIEKLESSTAQTFDGAEDEVDEELDFLSPHTAMNPETGELFPDGAPEPPLDLRPLQRAQLSDLLAFIHERIGAIIQHAVEETDRNPNARSIRCDWNQWQKLVNLQAELARYLHQIANPDR